MDYVPMIKEHMQKNGITYEALGNRMGISRQAVWNLLNKKNGSMTLKTLQRICNALGIEKF